MGTVNVVVKISLGGGQMLSSMITLDACKDMDLKVGDEAYAIIKSSSVMIRHDLALRMRRAPAGSAIDGFLGIGIAVL